jgi:hypothetical protein
MPCRSGYGMASTPCPNARPGTRDMGYAEFLEPVLSDGYEIGRGRSARATLGHDNERFDLPAGIQAMWVEGSAELNGASTRSKKETRAFKGSFDRTSGARWSPLRAYCGRTVGRRPA